MRQTPCSEEEEKPRGQEFLLPCVVKQIPKSCNIFLAKSGMLLCGGSIISLIHNTRGASQLTPGRSGVGYTVRLMHSYSKRGATNCEDKKLKCPWL